MFNSSINNGLTRANSAEIVSWTIPNYEEAVSLTISNSNVTILFDGVVLYPHTLTSSAPPLIVNNILVGHFGGTQVSGGFVYVPVKKGDLIKVGVAYNFPFIIVPYRGKRNA